MSRMVRKQVYIEPRQDEAIKRKSHELGVSESDLIRRGLDYVAQSAVTGPRDAAAWAEQLAFIRDRAARLAASGQHDVGGRGWTRDDLYDDRLRHVSR